MIARPPYLKVSAKIASGHGSILRKDVPVAVAVAVPVAVPYAVREAAAAHDLEVR